MWTLCEVPNDNYCKVISLRSFQTMSEIWKCQWGGHLALCLEDVKIGWSVVNSVLCQKRIALRHCLKITNLKKKKKKNCIKSNHYILSEITKLPKLFLNYTIVPTPSLLKVPKWKKGKGYSHLKCYNMSMLW
jgi:hypothetical protein